MNRPVPSLVEFRKNITNGDLGILQNPDEIIIPKGTLGHVSSWSQNSSLARIKPHRPFHLYHMSYLLEWTKIIGYKGDKIPLKYKLREFKNSILTTLSNLFYRDD